MHPPDYRFSAGSNAEVCPDAPVASTAKRWRAGMYQPHPPQVSLQRAADILALLSIERRADRTLSLPLALTI